MDFSSQKEILIEQLSLIRAKRPLIHIVTNFVVMNPTANALLAIGASPTMTWAPEDLEYLSSISDGLCINIGTPCADRIDVMEALMKIAEKQQKAVVLDPVGAGAGPYRTGVATRLYKFCPRKIVRGNVSEILSLVFENKEHIEQIAPHGVDTTTSLAEAKKILVDHGRIEGGNNSHLPFLFELFPEKAHAGAFILTGAEDYIVGAEGTSLIKGGHPIMSAVTGLGCILSALTTAFYAVAPDKPYHAAVAASLLVKIAGAKAAQRLKGPGFFIPEFFDALYTLNETEIRSFQP